IFLLGSALSGLSQSMAQLIVFRAIQGLGARSLITIGMTIIADLYGLERRAKMQGYFSASPGVASLVGPPIGRFLALAAAAATGFLSGMAMFGAITFVPLYLQAVTGSTAMQAGFVLVPFVFGWVVCSIIAARLVLRVGYRSVVVTGMCFLTAAFILLAGWSESLTRGAAMRDITLAGVGMGLVFVPMLIAVQSAVPRSVLGSATSVTGFFRSIGGAVGVAVMGSVMAQRLHQELAGLLAAAPAAIQDGLRQVAAHPDLIVNPLTRAGLGADVLDLMRPAMAHAVGSVFVVGLVVALLALASAFLVPAGQASELAVAQEPVAPSGS